ncbi:alpha/beta hydrolase [Mechercharimyces sp. CAU 1602]|uniref:alpha/beta hydrolase n=1 Tax=Mechercharimyces sp. CAU 1602 TaxID=2973933 RepID=UPI002161BC48|nr:alpha/beta hydrolase [Mechercharimyces sp. CAU 1602]MCS1350005.1 lysophospholipase [Mechercharimyces sp. CAU 1602]
MRADSFIFTASDGEEIFVYRWSPAGTCRGIVQIAHGMAEHAGRYDDFAKALTDAGYRVYANDHRGHGRTAGTQERLGHFADRSGWDRTMEDMHELTVRIRQENTSQQTLFLLGHSMGSFLARYYAQSYGDELAGLILSGTGISKGPVSSVGLSIAKLQGWVRGKKTRSKLLDRLSFGKFNHSFMPIRTSFDWLSRDEEEVDKYIRDPLCGQIATSQFFRDLITGVKVLDRPQHLQRIPSTLPIYLFSGAKDPVGEEGKGVHKVAKLLKDAGVKEVEIRLYEDGRHEMLNELNKEEVYHDVLTWLERHQ